MKRVLNDNTRVLENVAMYGIVKLGVNYEGDTYDFIVGFRVDREEFSLLDVSNISTQHSVLNSKVVLIKSKEFDEYVEKVFQHFPKEFKSRWGKPEPFCIRLKDSDYSKACFALIDQGTYSFINLTLSIKCLHPHIVEIETPSLFYQLIQRSGESLLNYLKKACEKRRVERIKDCFANHYYSSIMNRLNKKELKVKGLDENVIISIINGLRR